MVNARSVYPIQACTMWVENVNGGLYLSGISGLMLVLNALDVPPTCRSSRMVFI